MSKKFSRRDVLAIGAAGIGTGVLSKASLGAQSLKPKKQAKNIIFCVVDGMAASVMTMSDHYQQLMHGKRSYWSWLMDQPGVVNGIQDTRSLSSIVTDSSAAAGAWGSGRRQWNGQLNMFPDGTKLRTLYSLLSEKGLKTGLVTTTTITHATPSGFVIQIDSRGKEGEIASQHLSRGVDVLLGGGDRFFSPTSRTDKRDLYAEFSKKGYGVVKTRDQMLQSKAGKLLGIFSNSHLPYTVDRDNDPALKTTVPTLAEMVQVALNRLKGGKEGFILQIEGGKVDHGGHANDLAALFYDQLAFEDAVKVAVTFALADKETLLIITSDHATGGPALNGAGEEYFDSTDGLKSISKMKSSYGRLFELYRANRTRGGVQDATEALLGIKLSAEEADAILGAMSDASPFKASEFLRSLNGTAATVFGNHSKVLWTSQNHTADHVLVSALGPGSELFAGMTWNVAMFDAMLATRGITYSNPKMTFDQAKRYMGAKGAASERAFIEDPETELLDLQHQGLA